MNNHQSGPNSAMITLTKDFLIKYSSIAGIMASIQYVIVVSKNGEGLTAPSFIGQILGTIVGTLLISALFAWIVSLLSKDSFKPAFIGIFYLLLISSFIVAIVES